jgi:hypothetical protein
MLYIAVISASLFGLCAVTIGTTLVLLKHRHNYQPFAVQKASVPAAAGHDRLTLQRSTTVLYRCPCGEVTTRVFSGVWGLSDIVGGTSVTT